ncbi:hypothetical protein [Myroides marinus]|uniref:hypothetical protein n=1 Tax=Myroides marinus TaxID=703342 RepID=UPI0025754D11|nr:hypothetical protein [Myroides marinus]MDM1348440.1 hypothetical protein [Myroides marinus]
MRRSVGGYLALELNKGQVVHSDAIAVNSGRNGLRYILQVRKYSKIYVPYYTCDVVLTTIEELGIVYDFYKIDSKLEPIFEWEQIKENEVFLYTNYFGIKDEYVRKLVKQIKKCIIDNAQAFYADPITGIDSFYSPRKFLGVPDGGYVYCDAETTIEDQDVSYERMSHLLKRLEFDAEEGYGDFVENEKYLDNSPLKRMSVITEALIGSADHQSIKNKRINNYNYFYKAFKEVNKIDLPLAIDSVPLVFPLWIDKEVKSTLQSNRCYTATYWSKVLEWTVVDSLEYKLTKEVVYLPIDQNIAIEELKLIINLIK